MQPMTTRGASEAISTERIPTKIQQTVGPRSDVTGTGSTNVGSDMITPVERTLRADAARNRQRVLTAAARVFGERGLTASMDEVARAAGVGVGTVYRRFPSKEKLVDALFEDKVENLVVLARDAAAFDDPWAGFVYFIERALEWQAQNPGLRDVLVRGQLPCAGAGTTRGTDTPGLTAVIERAQATGKLRPDVDVSDVPMLVAMLGAASDYVDPRGAELGQRYMALMLDGLVSDRAAWTPLSNPPIQALLNEPDPARVKFSPLSAEPASSISRRPKSNRERGSGTTEREVRRVYDYALIGDTLTAALVHLDGSVDWLCLPRFDSAAVFARLVGVADNGRWRLDADAPVLERIRRYRGDTMILETELSTGSGRVEIVDFMSPREEHPTLVRLVYGLTGRVRMTMDLRFRFGYGEVIPWVRTIDGVLQAVSGPDRLSLHTPVTLVGEGPATTASFDVEAGECVPFVLVWSQSHEDPPGPPDPLQELEETERYWTEWSSQHSYTGEHSPIVLRSLLTLKALTYAPTGAIVAAPTTSLPEALGGERNWDYRYTWLRDAAATLHVLLSSGYMSEARDWRSWLLRAAFGDVDKLQIMYGVAGERLLPEITLDWLPGHEGSTPVRIGNAASTQRQLDVYGEVILALELGRKVGLPDEDDGWHLERALLDFLAHNWQKPDQGLWEIRGEPRHFVSSKLMAWAGVERMIKAAEKYGLSGPVEKWRDLRDAMRADILAHGHDPRRNTFVQSYGSTELDASLLVIPLLGFLPANDPRVLGTIAAIEEDLLVDGLLQRYRTLQAVENSVDGLPPGEGVFLACSFLLVEVYILVGRIAEAEQLFDRLMLTGNDLGLFAEEYDPVGGLLLGNFPQALTHVAQVHAAMRLAAAGPSTEIPRTRPRPLGVKTQRERKGHGKSSEYGAKLFGTHREINSPEPQQKPSSRQAD
ncbi:MAG: glucoamylase [Acidimicrobiaceae bacterium]|nr:glucoamylase [Acidimicrobiaceae bacterium]